MIQLSSHNDLGNEYDEGRPLLSHGKRCNVPAETEHRYGNK